MHTTLSTITPATFADLMAELPAGVTVVTTAGASGPVGLTVTSMTAFSADPPSVMVSIAHGSRCHERLLATDRFGVHVLHSGQEPVARVFASRIDDKFAELDWSWDGDVPHLHGALTYMRCTREAEFTHRDHTIVIGTIEDAALMASAEPLLYLRRRFSWRFS